MAHETYSDIPIINISALVSGTEDRYVVASRMRHGCRDHGSFYIVGHGVNQNLQHRLEEISRRFFASPAEFRRWRSRT
jgi:isopenicillin N synthase-like dioxygenase